VLQFRNVDQNHSGTEKCVQITGQEGNSNTFSFLNSTRKAKESQNRNFTQKSNQLPDTKHSPHSRQLNKFPSWGHRRYSQSHFTADSQSVSQSVCLGVEPTLWTSTRYCFLFKCLGLKFVVLSLWGALSDERPGLSCVSHSLVICLCVHLLFTFLSFAHLLYIYIYYTIHIIYTRPLLVPARNSRLCPTTH
jgi:hypothetical protein